MQFEENILFKLQLLSDGLVTMLISVAMQNMRAKLPQDAFLCSHKFIQSSKL